MVEQVSMTVREVRVWCAACGVRERGCVCERAGQQMSLGWLFSACDLVGTLAFQTSGHAVTESRVPEPLVLTQGLR